MPLKQASAPSGVSGDLANLPICGLCQTPICQPTPYGKPVLNPALRLAYGSAARVQVSLTVGEQDYEWRAGETTSFDICPDCFATKLKPWLEAQGAEAKVEAWSS